MRAFSFDALHVANDFNVPTHDSYAGYAQRRRQVAPCTAELLLDSPPGLLKVAT